MEIRSEQTNQVYAQNNNRSFTNQSRYHLAILSSEDLQKERYTQHPKKWAYLKKSLFLYSETKETNKFGASHGQLPAATTVKSSLEGGR